MRGDATGQLKPETSVYRVTLQLVEAPLRWNQAAHGTVLVNQYHGFTGLASGFSLRR
jgi:hypothetical protein